MSTATLHRSEPMSSGEIPTDHAERAVDIERKHRMLGEFLETHRFDALLLERPANIAWLTAGADATRGDSSETTVSVFITPEARVILCADVDSAQVFDRAIPGLGFQLKQRPWFEPRHILAEDLCRGRVMASDTGFGGSTDVSAHLAGLRTPLSVLERERIRQVGRRVAHAVEATARTCEPGQSEAEIAGQLAHRLIRHQVAPVRLQVWADGQATRYRHWSFGSQPVRRYCTIAAVGRQFGLHVAAARTVCFGNPPQELRQAYHRALLMQSTGMFFSQPDWPIHETWERVQRIYEKFDCPEEWRRADQGAVIGYEICEAPIVPRSEFRLQPRLAVHWHPSVGPAMVSDTILLEDSGFQLLTVMENWPRVTVEVKNTPIPRPDILIRSA